MKTFLAILLIILASIHTLSAQKQADDNNVFWAARVLEYSSYYNRIDDPKQYAPEQVLGPPNGFLSNGEGESPVMWAPATPNATEEFIKVAFDKPVKGICQIAVAECSRPGAITEIYLYDQQNQAYLVYKNPAPAPTREKSRMFRVFIEPTAYAVTAAKIVLAPVRVPGYNCIDAIGISTSRQLIEAVIPVAEDVFEWQPQAEKLSEVINSPYIEIAPNISPDGSVLYFTRENHPDNIPLINERGQKEYRQDIWYSLINPDQSFSEPVNLGPPINNPSHNSSFSISADGATMLVNNIYMSDGSMRKGVSIARKVDGKWQQPEPIEIEGFENSSEYSEYCLSADGRILLMAIRMNDSHGGKDLYVAFRKGEKLFSKPKNLGPVVNTAANEMSPFLAADGKTLYFASTGHPGYGSSDIFMTQRLDDTWTNWSPPKNLGPAVNTVGWEAYFTISASGEYAYFVSNEDIYRIQVSLKSRPKIIVMLTGQVRNEKNKAPIAAQIEIQASDSTLRLQSDRQGLYQAALYPKTNYTIYVHAKGFFSKEVSLDLSEVADYQEVVKDIELTPLEKGARIRLENIYFARARADLLPESYPALDALAETLIENPNTTILLEGHTEPYGNRKSLIKLSEDRVRAVGNYLVRRGVHAKRIRYKAYGGTQPITLQDDEESRALNRRVEVKVLK